MTTIFADIMAYLSGPNGVVVGLLVSLIGIPASAYMGHRLALNWPSSQKKKIDDRINWIVESAKMHAMKTENHFSGMIVTISFTGMLIVLLIMSICITVVTAESIPHWVKLLALIASLLIVLRLSFLFAKSTRYLSVALTPEKEIDAVKMMLKSVGTRVYQPDELRQRQDLLDALSAEFQEAYKLHEKYEHLKLE